MKFITAVKEKIDIGTEIAKKKQRLVDFEFIDEQSAVHNFLCSDLENFRKISTKCRF